MANSRTYRRFIRHPAGIPIEISLDRVADDLRPEAGLKNVSVGGLSFHFTGALPIGQVVKINFPLFNANTTLTAKVVWNRKLDDRSK